MITENQVREAAKLTYIDFLKGRASKEEDFRCILYFHLRYLKGRKKGAILLNPKKFGKCPDIVIIDEDGRISYIEIKQFINFRKNKLDEDMIKLKLYRKSDCNFGKGYLIHFYRNFQEWKKFKKYDKDRDIRNIYFPDEDCELLINSFLSKPRNRNQIIKKSLSCFKKRGILRTQEELKKEFDDYLKDNDKSDKYAIGWVPVNSYIERDEFLAGGYQKVIKSIVKETKEDRSPVRFYSDCLNLSKKNIRSLEKRVETGNKNLIDLIIRLEFNELLRERFLEKFSPTT